MRRQRLHRNAIGTPPGIARGLAQTRLGLQQDVEQAFLHNPADAITIYQLKPGEDTRYLRFESLAAVTA